MSPLPSQDPRPRGSGILGPVLGETFICPDCGGKGTVAVFDPLDDEAWLTEPCRRCSVRLVEAALAQFSREPRSWTPNHLARAVAKASGWPLPFVWACLWNFSTDGYAATTTKETDDVR